MCERERESNKLTVEDAQVKMITRFIVQKYPVTSV